MEFAFANATYSKYQEIVNDRTKLLFLIDEHEQQLIATQKQLESEQQRKRQEILNNTTGFQTVREFKAEYSKHKQKGTKQS